MARRIEELTVETDSENKIRISQDGFHEDGSTIVISPDEVDILCQWLKEQRDTIKGQE